MTDKTKDVIKKWTALIVIELAIGVLAVGIVTWLAPKFNPTAPNWVGTLLVSWMW